MKTLVVMAALALCACASDPHEEMFTDARNVDSLAHDLAEEAGRYCSAAPWTAPASCADAAAAHRAAVAARTEALLEMAARMDRHLEEVGSGALADVACGVPAAQAENDRYAGPCAGTDPTTAEAEALRHCSVLAETAAQLHVRANAVLGAIRHSTRVGGSGSSPGHLRPLPTGVHPWPWATGSEPAGGPICVE